MAKAKAQEASSGCNYDVFLSFRGEDTRKKFTDHLYTALIQAGIHTFRDDDELKKGENIEIGIKKAIEESRLSIIVFSNGYASSRWCLDELVMITKRSRTVEHIVVPVFYDVDPTEVSEQSGRFGEIFAAHEQYFMEEMNRVEGWRAALREVADLGGFVLQDRYEAPFIRNIVKDIRSKLSRKVLNVSPYLVGIDFDVARINIWLQDVSTNTRIMIIYGIGGVGKTTIAKTVYNMNYDNFEGRSFLANIKETSEQLNGLLHIQRQLLSDILKDQPINIYNVDEGIIKVKEAICCRRVLIVLDDVDHIDQFNAIIGMQKWLYPGSKIIITTRYASLFNVNYEGCLILKIMELDDDSSMQLFSWHLFGQDHPPEGFVKVSKRVVNYCSGLPLALQVLASSLRGKRVDLWESELRKLEEIPDGKIQKILRISCDSLQDDHDKNIFLDIACFFVGMDKDYVVKILDECGFYTVVGLQNLIDRCLITVNEHKQIMMHQLIRDMGREIVRQESPEDPGKRSRLWNHGDALTALKENTGSEAVKALTFSPPNEVELKLEGLAKMQRLKLLQLCNVKLKGSYEDFPKNLVWLSWRGFSLKSIPISFDLEKLAVLEMPHSYLKCLWERNRNLPNLKILNLSHSHFLVTTPNFRGLPNLERLILQDCINLVEIDESIEVLQRIVLLNLRDCKNLRKLPRKLASLKSLEELVLSGCLELDELPKVLAEMNLKVLVVDGNSINQLNSTSDDASKLNFLSATSWDSTFHSWLSPRKGPKSMKFSFTFLPRTLVTLSLANCNLLDDHIPKDLSMLPSLQHLNLGGNPIHALPESISSLTSLRSLLLDHCERLQYLPELPPTLKELDVNHCRSLERITNLPNLFRRLIFRSYGCENLDEVEGAFKLQPIRNIDMEMITALGMFNLESLESFQVQMVNCLTGTLRTTSVQVLHECGIFSIYIPGSEIPGWYSYQNAGRSISFNVNRVQGHKIIGLNLCVVYAFDQPANPRSDYKICGKPFTHIKNTNNGLSWNYSPTFYEIPGEQAYNLWLSHWKYVDKMEDGDEVFVGVGMPSGIQVIRVGVHLVYEEEKDGSQSQSITSSSWYQDLSNADVSAFRHRTGYILGYNHYGRDVQKLRWDTLLNGFNTNNNPQVSTMVNILTRIHKCLTDML
ncbi:disease resistance protein RPV1-like isoform X2 [Hevea brasiliensis]|uniref:disease resistance protein RPV1-like isoform X2 n=1 Tax=Hevea brasiliensis TaxID=3981 RepID=UPI0025F9CB4E|nr:disease resistance protein RPV1-like isoform X2 [Hevea brasiliensis]